MNPSESGTPRRNWDPVVKLTHWGVVTAVVANALFTREGGNYHVWVGYGLASLLALRLLWGLIGPEEARFSAFPPSLRGGLAHVWDILAGKKTAHSSHNPLGALMVYAIWGTLGVIIATGIVMAGLPGVSSGLERAKDREVVRMQDGAPGQGGHMPLVARQTERMVSDEEARESTGSGQEAKEDGEDEGPLGELHEGAVNLLYLLIALHLAGVIFETRRSGREILLSMVPGRR